MLVHGFLFDSAQKAPDKLASVCTDKRLRYRELEERSNQLARALMDAGVERGERVAVFLNNCGESIISMFGILKAGAAFVMVNPTTKADKLAYMLNDCGATAIITSGQLSSVVSDVETTAESLRAAVVTCGWEVSIHGALRNRRIDFEHDLVGFSTEPPRVRCIDMDLAAIIYTSGSTGRPKGVVMTHRNMVSAADSITEYLENVEDDIILNVLPLSFGYGLYQALTAVKIGATLVLEKSFAYPYQIVERVREEQVTGFPGVPTMFALLLQMTDLDPADFDAVRYVTNAGAALPPSHIARLRRLFRKARIYSMYGITECTRVTYLPPNELERRPTSVGKAMPNCETSIVDPNGNPVAPGEVGELVVRGSNVMQGYWNLPEETNKALRPGRYPWERVLHTGDLFRMDEEEYLYFVARQDDIIKSRGEKVSPREVENTIHEMAEVQEAAVVGVPDPILGAAIKAIVVKARGAPLSEADVIAHCARRLENYMVPKIVEFRDGLPKTTSGKIARAQLKADEQAAKGAAGAAL